MPKGWAAQTRSARWLAAGIVAVVLGLAVIWVLFVPTRETHCLLRQPSAGSRGTGDRLQPSCCQVQPPLMLKAFAPARLTVSGPVKLLLSMMLLVSVLASVAS
jgi:hypothetical protein